MINPGVRYRGQQIFAGPGVGSGLVVFTGMASGTWLNELEPQVLKLSEGLCHSLLGMHDTPRIKVSVLGVRVFGLGVQGQSYFVQDYDLKA